MYSEINWKEIYALHSMEKDKQLHFLGVKRDVPNSLSSTLAAVKGHGLLSYKMDFAFSGSGQDATPNS